jgi:hypothetical protein
LDLLSSEGGFSDDNLRVYRDIFHRSPHIRDLSQSSIAPSSQFAMLEVLDVIGTSDILIPFIIINKNGEWKYMLF